LVYVITNELNGKRYVGQTRQGLARRRGEHMYRFTTNERDHKLYQAMRKHGVENFSFNALCSVLTPDHLDDLERHFVAEFNSFNRGYNMTCGGDSVSDETRAKLSAIMKGRKITWYDKILASRRLNPGRHPRDFVARGAANSNAKAYRVRFPDGRVEEFRGLRAFCKQNGLTHFLMLDTLKGVQRHHKGFALLARLNDYPAREYGQVAGNAAGLTA